MFTNAFRPLLTPKESMDYYQYFWHKMVQFGMFWVLIPKIDTWGIFSTQFWPLNKNFSSKSIVEFWKWLAYKLMDLKVSFKILRLIRFLNFESKFILSGQNWVVKMTHMSILRKKINKNPYLYLMSKVA